MRDKIISILVIALLGYSVIALSSCANLSTKDSASASEALLEPQGILKFSDLPVPTGFKLLPQMSYTFESAGIRVGMLKYRGKASGVEQVVNFYRDQMPLYNWHLLNAVQYGEHILNFEREQESCIVRLSPKWNSITIAIAIGPKAAITPKKAEKPVK